jgi:hypothetical protein
MELENLDERIVGHILKIPTKDARAKIMNVMKKVAPEKFHKGTNPIRLKDQFEDEEIVCTVSQFEAHTGIPISIAIKSIHDNFHKHVATREMILAYPETRIKPSKKTGLLPLTVGIPPVLKRLIPVEHRKEIVEQWILLYPKFIENGGIFKV